MPDGESDCVLGLKPERCASYPYVAQSLNVTGPDGVGVGVGVGVAVGTGVAVRAGVGEGDGVALPDGVGVALPDGVGVALPDGVGVVLPDGRGVGLGDGLPTGVAVAVTRGGSDVPPPLHALSSRPSNRPPNTGVRFERKGNAKSPSYGGECKVRDAHGGGSDLGEARRLSFVRTLSVRSA